MLDVGWGDLIDYLGDDPNTKSIVIYMESIGDARSFLSAAREVALTKPIIVIKAGRTEAAAKAAASHTGSLAGSDEVLDAAFRRVGVLRVNAISEVFDMAEVLAKQPRPARPAAGDRHQCRRPRRAGHRRPDRERRRARHAVAETHRGAQHVPARPPGATTTRSTSSATPTPKRYAQTLEVAAKDPGIDGLLVDPDPAGHDRPDRDRRAAQAVRQGRRQAGAGQLDGRRAGRGRRGRSSTRRASPPSPIPTRPHRSSHCMWRSSYNLRALYETPTLAGRRQRRPPRAPGGRGDHRRRAAARGGPC